MKVKKKKKPSNTLISAVKLLKDREKWLFIHDDSEQKCSYWEGEIKCEKQNSWSLLKTEDKIHTGIFTKHRPDKVL